MSTVCHYGGNSDKLRRRGWVINATGLIDSIKKKQYEDYIILLLLYIYIAPYLIKNNYHKAL